MTAEVDRKKTKEIIREKPYKMKKFNRMKQSKRIAYDIPWSQSTPSCNPSPLRASLALKETNQVMKTL